MSKPAGTVDGDVLVCFMDPTILKSHTPPSGWTASVSSGDGGGNLSIMTDYKVASSEPSSTNFVFTATASHDFPCVLVCLSNCRASPLDQTNNNGSTSSITSLVANGVTTGEANEMLLVAYLYKNSSAFTVPAGMTLVGSETGGGVGYTITVCSQLIASAGATGTRTATIGTASAQSCYAAMSFKPVVITPQFWTDYIKSVEVDT
jgi:hypothetical protein